MGPPSVRSFASGVRVRPGFSAGRRRAPFFRGVARVARLREAADSWIGTPFRKHQRVKRAGVDCVQLAGAIYIECGALSAFHPGPYALDGGFHGIHSQVIHWLERQDEFERVNPPHQPGDLLTFRMGRFPHHVAILLDGLDFVHCVRFNGGVRINSLVDSTWNRRLDAVFRPVQWEVIP